MNLIESERLQLHKFSLQFARAETEEIYLAWRLKTIIPFIRIGQLAVLLNWALALTVGGLAIPEKFSFLAPAILLVMMPAHLISLLTTCWIPARKLVVPTAALSSLLDGLGTVWLSHEVVGLPNAPTLMVGCMMISGLFGLVIYRLRPSVAICSVMPGFCWAAFFLLEDLQVSTLTYAETLVNLTLLGAGLLSGICVCVVLEIVTRGTFVNQRLIDRQRAELEKSNEEVVKSREQIRRYVPPAVADHIIAGEQASVDLPQRRRVTVMFSDIVGFTDVADRQDAESLTQIINEYMSAMAEIVGAYGGTLNEFAGDGLMALFGAPDEMPPEQQVFSAVQAAQVMQYRMPLLNKAWLKLGIDEPLKIRIGINTGVLSVGSFGSAGRVTYTAIGLHTNIAARIQSHCIPGEVLLSHSSWQLVKDRIQCDPFGAIDIKGVHYKVKTYQVCRVDGEPAARGY